MTRVASNITILLIRFLSLANKRSTASNMHFPIMNDMHYALDPTLPYLVNTIDQSNIFGTGSTCVSAEVYQALTSFNPRTLANCPSLAALQGPGKENVS